ncbi:hypothetical protein CR513_26448, partial [Mucuna pruriens]
MIIKNSCKILFDSKFNIKDLGSLRYFLCLKVAWSKDDSDNLVAKPTSTPHDPSLKIHIIDSTPYHDPSAYRKLIGDFLI